MGYFFAGLAVGVILTALVVAVSLYFETRRKGIIRYISSNPLVRPKGFIVEPNDHEEARQEIMKRNNKRGLPTRLEEL